jgi:hypothetical protein
MSWQIKKKNRTKEKERKKGGKPTATKKKLYKPKQEINAKKKLRFLFFCFK